MTPRNATHQTENHVRRYEATAGENVATTARRMEGRMARGETLEGCAHDASLIADSEGITGFMYGCAVSILAKVWAR